jgi:hypothetical protein
MVESTVLAAEAATELYRQAALKRAQPTQHTFTIVVEGPYAQTFTVEATTASELAALMSAKGIDTHEDKWAAGYRGERGDLQIYGNDGAAEATLAKLLRGE